MADKIYGLSERDRALVQKWIRQLGHAPHQGVPAQRGGQKVRSTTDRFRFRNDSGETIPPCAIMRCTGTELDSDNNLVYVMNKPATTEWKMPWYVNLGVEVSDDDYGWSATFRSEMGQGYYLSGTIVVGDSWGPKGGQWNLERYYPGFVIRGKEADGLVYVNQDTVTELFGTLDGALAQGSSATMSVYAYNGSSWTDTAFNITVNDRLLKIGAPDIDSGNWMVAHWYCGKWWAVSAECN